MSEGGCCAPCGGAKPCAVAARLESTSAPLVAIAQVPRRTFETVVITDFPLTGWCPQSAPEKYSQSNYRVVVTPNTFKASRPM